MERHRRGEACKESGAGEVSSNSLQSCESESEGEGESGSRLGKTE